MAEQNNANIQGEPLELDVLLDFAIIDPEDITTGILWFDENASDGWVGALEAEHVNG